MATKGDRIGAYVLERKLGKGASKEVWLASKTNRFVTTNVALGILKDEFNEEALVREAQIWRSLGGHPNVNRLIDVEEVDGQVVILSDLVEGGSLVNWLNDRRGAAVDEKLVLRIVRGVLAGLDHLHHCDPPIIHRDLKPGNVLMRGETPVLTDFGLSRWLDDTRSQHIAGTPAYMAPELLEDSYSAQSDLWAVGVIMHVMLSGGLPFGESGMNPVAMLKAAQEAAPKPLPASISRAAKQIVERALQKRPGDRYESASDMLAAVDSALGGVAPSGTVTVMFTDIVGSTGLKSRMPGQTTEERDQSFRATIKDPLDELVRNAIGIGGFVAKDTGDGLLITFSNAETAVQSALEIQRALAASPVAGPEGVVQLRIGLNTGHVEYRNNDYIGAAVDMAKRVQDAAEPATVFVSQATYALVTGRLGGVQFDRTERVPLKGLGQHDLYTASFEVDDIFPLGHRQCDQSADVSAVDDPASVKVGLSGPLLAADDVDLFDLGQYDLSAAFPEEGDSGSQVIVLEDTYDTSLALDDFDSGFIRLDDPYATTAALDDSDSMVLDLLSFDDAAIEAPAQEASIVTLTLAPGITMELARIPAGEFLMGDDDQQDNPRVVVYLDEFYMQTTPVTVPQYRAFCQEKRRGRLPSRPFFDRDWKSMDSPIVNVTFQDALDFCDWVSAKTGRNVRLPTEHEWEKAARGTDGKKYPWGNKDLKKAIASGLVPKGADLKTMRTNPVARFRANEFGLFDMAGNVWQMCDSRYDNKHDRIVARGAGWALDAQERFYRTSFRNSCSTTNVSNNAGFRCVLQ